MKVAIQQPSYLPWCGYFAKMRQCDNFIILDNVQMPGGQSYLYRTKVRVSNGEIWLSIPTHHNLDSLISNVEFTDRRWSKKHLNTLRSSYGKSPYFSDVFSLLEPFYTQPGEMLSDFNTKLIIAIKDYLGIQCKITFASSIKTTGKSDDRLIELVKEMGGHTYISGKGGQKYQDPDKFKAAGINLAVAIYEPNPYKQIHGGFVGGLSIVDALFNLGPQTINLLVYSQLNQIINI